MDGDPRLLEYVRTRFGDLVELKPLGKHGKSLLVLREGGASLVVKAIASEGKWKRYLWAREFLDSRGLPVPTLALPPCSLPHEGLFLIFEEFLPGTPLGRVELTPSVVEAVVGAMKALHAIESGKWGVPVKKVKRRGFYRHFYRRVSQVAQKDPSLRRRLEKARWIPKVLKGLEREEQRYQMTHGDLHGNNLILGDGLVFLDLVRAGFGSYVKDLVRIDVWERRERGTRKIFERYVEGVEDPLLEEKLKIFYLGEFVRRREVDWVREALNLLLDKGEVP